MMHQRQRNLRGQIKSTSWQEPKQSTDLYLSAPNAPLLPLDHIWDVMLVWRTGNINKTVSVLQYCAWWCTMVREVLTCRSTVSGFDLAWFSSIFWAPLCLRSSWCYIDTKKFMLTSFRYLLVSWAWWDWPLTWFTNHHSSVLWRWLGVGSSEH